MGDGERCPVAGRSGSLMRGVKVLLRTCAEKEVQDPSMNLNPKAKATGLPSDCCQGQARLLEGSCLPTTFLPSSAGPPPRAWSLPACSTPTHCWLGGRQEVFRGGCAGGRFSQSKKRGRTVLAELPQIQTLLAS